MEARCKASSVRTRVGNGSRALARTGGGEIEQSNPSHERARVMLVGIGQLAGVNPRPELVLEQPAGDQRLPPQSLGWYPVLGEKLSQSDRGVEVDHRPFRSSFSSRSSSSNAATGARGGAPSAGTAGGGVHAPRGGSRPP